MVMLSGRRQSVFLRGCHRQVWRPEASACDVGEDRLNDPAGMTLGS